MRTQVKGLLRGGELETRVERTGQVDLGIERTLVGHIEESGEG